LGENRSFVAGVVVLAASLVAVGGVRADTTPVPDPAPTPAPDPAPVVHPKPKPHVVTHVVRTTPRPAAPAPTPVVVTPAAPAPVVHTTTHVATTKKTHVRKRVHAAKPNPEHAAARSRPPAPTTTAPLVSSIRDQSTAQVTAGARVHSFSSQWQRLLSWLLLVGSLIVLACAALPTMMPGATLVVEGRVQLALLGAALAAGGVSLLIASGA
jgi:outer membrane biosynthesis protein TonB